MFTGRLWSMLSLAASVVCAHINEASLMQRGATSRPIPSKEDPWYTAPAGYEAAAPGELLRIRSAPGNLSTVVANSSAAYHVLFRTTNSYAQPAFAVTTVFVPISSSQPSSLLSYQIPYNSADLDASPSFTLYGAASNFPDIPAALGQGQVVSVPDFEGPLPSFLMGLTEGRAVLDSIRSILSHPAFGLSPNTTKTALWGYSGGSIASLFALELAKQYAPDLALHGAAIGGTVSNFATTVSLLNSSPQAGLVPAALLGLTSQSPTARQLLISSLQPAHASQFLAAANLSLEALQEAFDGTDITSLFTNYSSFAFDPEILAIQKDNWHLGYHGIPQTPIFLYKAIGDEVAPIEEVDDLVGRWCSLGGVDIRYERNRVGNHETEYINGVARARKFLESVFNGANNVVPLHGGCTSQEVTVGSSVIPT